MTNNEIKNILRSLPFNLYTQTEDKTRLTIVDNQEAVYINLLTKEITVGLQMFNRVKPEALDESMVRSIFYHEVSHAILSEMEVMNVKNFSKEMIFNTANNLGFNISITKEEFPLSVGVLKNLLNIIEDERIETLLKDYYLDVDFKRLVLNAIVNIDEEIALGQEAGKVFFDAVRGRKEPFTNIVEKLLQPLLKAEVTYKDYLPLLAFYLYLYDNQEKMEQSESNRGDSTESDSSSLLNNIDIDELDKLEKKINDMIEDAKQSDGKELIKDRINKIKAGQEDAQREEMVKAEMSQLHDIDTLIRKIALKGKTKSMFRGGKKGTSYVNSNIDIHKAYDMVGNKYKIFKSNNGVDKGKRKAIINFIIDTSGSFGPNQDKVNGILLKLIQLEKKYTDFEFTLTTFNNKNEKQLQGNNRQIDCGGGTCLSKNFEKLFKETHKLGEHTIFLLDGKTNIEYPMKTLDFMDQRGVYICADEYNSDYFNTFKKAKVDLVSAGYLEHLEEFIIKSLTTILLKSA